MKVNIKIDDMDFNIMIPNRLLLNKITFNLISKKIQSDIECDSFKTLFKTLKKYLKEHPDFVFLEIASDDATFTITS